MARAPPSRNNDRAAGFYQYLITIVPSVPTNICLSICLYLNTNSCYASGGHPFVHIRHNQYDTPHDMHKTHG